MRTAAAKYKHMLNCLCFVVSGRSVQWALVSFDFKPEGSSKKKAEQPATAKTHSLVINWVMRKDSRNKLRKGPYRWALHSVVWIARHGRRPSHMTFKGENILTAPLKACSVAFQCFKVPFWIVLSIKKTNSNFKFRLHSETNIGCDWCHWSKSVCSWC